MINAAFYVFAERGYYYASTDEIVRTANISKGLLFHYFGSKIGLYAFLYDYATRFATLELTQNVDKDENGYFELFKQIVSAKANAMAQYPYIYLFLKKAEEETHPEALAQISERRDKYRRIMEALRERADITELPPHFDYNRLGDILEYTIEGLLADNVKGENFRADLFLEEAEEYVDMIQKMVLA